MKSKTAKVCSQAIDQYRIPPFFEPEWLFCYSNRSFIKPNPGFVDKRAGLAVYARSSLSLASDQSKPSRPIKIHLFLIWFLLLWLLQLQVVLYRLLMMQHSDSFSVSFFKLCIFAE